MYCNVLYQQTADTGCFVPPPDCQSYLFLVAFLPPSSTPPPTALVWQTLSLSFSLVCIQLFFNLGTIFTLVTLGCNRCSRLPAASFSSFLSFPLLLLQKSSSLNPSPRTPRRPVSLKACLPLWQLQSLLPNLIDHILIRFVGTMWNILLHVSPQDPSRNHFGTHSPSTYWPRSVQSTKWRQ